MFPEAVGTVMNDAIGDFLWHTLLHSGPLHGQAVAASRCLHFTIIALTVDRGRSGRGEISQTDLWQRCHPMTVPCLNH